MCKAKSPKPTITKPEKPGPSFNVGGQSSTREDALGAFSAGSRESLRIDAGSTPRTPMVENDKPVDYQHREAMAEYLRKTRAYAADRELDDKQDLAKIWYKPAHLKYQDAKEWGKLPKL